MASLLLAIEPFWGRAIVYNVETKVEIEFSISMVLSNDYATSYLEAINLFYDLRTQLLAKSLSNFSTVVIEVTEAQSDESQQAILKAAINSEFNSVELVLYENTRLLWALQHLTMESRVDGITVAVVDVWQNEAFAHLLKCEKVEAGMASFKSYGYFSIQSKREEGFGAEELQNFADKLQSQGAALDVFVVASGEFDVECEKAFDDPIFYDAEERKGTLYKAIALHNGKHQESGSSRIFQIDVRDSIEYSLKLIIGDQKHTIADAYDVLPITFEKVITLDKPTNALEFCRQWPSSSICESYGRTNIESKKVIKIKCAVDKQRKIDLNIE